MKMKGNIQMNKRQETLINRINMLCNEKNYSYYTLAYKAGMSLTTLMHIMDGSSKNPGIFTIFKICNGLEVSLMEFFDDKDFEKLLNEMTE